MYTEYIFDDKKYEVASKNLKSILFDIINAEGIRLADIRQKIAEADDSELKDKLVNLCNQHEKTILSTLGISNKLNETLQNLDTFSKDLKELENEGIAVIVNNYMEQQNKTNNEEVKENAAIENNSTNEVEAEDKSLENDSVETVDDTVKTEETQTVDDSDKTVNSAEESVQEEVHNQDPVSEVPIIQNNTVDDNNSQIFGQDLIENEKTVETDDVVSQENIENIFPAEKTPVVEETPVVDNSSAEVETPVVENVSEETENTEKNDAPVIESSEDVTPSIVDSVPVDDNNDFIPKVVQTEEEKSSNEVPTSEGEEAVSSESDEIVNDVADTAEVGTDKSIDGNINEESESSELEEKYIFEKQDSLEPKVILTSANQVAKLRASRDSNISLLTAKQFFKFGNAEKSSDLIGDSNLVFPDAVQDSELIPQTEKDITQQELVNTDNSEEKELTKEEQMEQMMQQITALYKDGKVDEAQALSDKISEMNKQIQETQETQKVLAA